MNHNNVIRKDAFKFKHGDKIVWDGELGVVVDRSSYTHWIIKTNYGAIIHVYDDELQLDKNQIVQEIIKDL